MKKAGVTHKKNETSVRFSPREQFLRKQLQAERHRAWQAGLEESCRRQFPYGRGILYWGRRVQTLVTPLAVAKVLAEELRVNPSVGAQLLMKVVQGRRNVKGFVPRIMKLLGEYLEAEQPVFDKMDYQIVDIVQQHPDYTIKEITFELSKEYPEEKWTERKLKTLARRVQRFLENVPWLPKEHADPDSWSDTY